MTKQPPYLALVVMSILSFVAAIAGVETVAVALMGVTIASISGAKLRSKNLTVDETVVWAMTVARVVGVALAVAAIVAGIIAGVGISIVTWAVIWFWAWAWAMAWDASIWQFQSRGFSQGFAIASLLLTVILGIALGMGLIVGFLNPYILLVVGETSLILIILLQHSRTIE